MEVDFDDPNDPEDTFDPACGADPAKFGPIKIQVTIPLEGSGVTPDDYYTRRIYAGWVFPPDDLHHFRVSLTKGDMHDDHEHPDPFDLSDCECAFFFMNVDRAPDEWQRPADFDEETCQSELLDVCVSTNVIDDWDDDQDIGNGELNFNGPTYDFYIGNGQPYTIRATMYDGGVGEDLPLNEEVGVDCLDDHFGEHDFGDHVNINIFPPEFPSLCYAFLPLGEDRPDNDAFNHLERVVNPPYPVGAMNVPNGGSEYDLDFSIEEVPLTAEEAGADLVLTKDCKPAQGALAGVEFTCTILVENPQGPGLPSDVVVHDTLLTDVDPDDYVLEPPTFTFSGVTNLTDPCITEDNPIEEIPGGVEFFCNIGTVPIGGKAIITMRITSDEGGDFNNYANVFSASPDPDMSNNRDDDSVHVVPVADLSITKSDSEDPLVSGTSLTYSLQVHNDGPSTAVNVRAEDLLPAGVSIISVSGSGGASCVFGVPGDNSRPTVCTFGSIPSGGSRTMTIVVTVLPGSHNTLHNDARVSSDVLDLNNANDFDSEDTQIRVTDLEIVKTSDADVYKSSGTVAYSIQVRNNGPADAENVVVTDDLPLIKQDRVIWLPGAPTCTKPVGGTLLTCNLGTIQAEGTRTIIVIVVYKGSRGLIDNTADVATSTFDHDLANNSSTRTVQVGTLPKP